MDSNGENRKRPPNMDIENEIHNILHHAEKDINECNFISAYNSLKRIHRMLFNLPKTNDKMEELKKKHRKLSNELNSKILKFIQENRNKGRS